VTKLVFVDTNVLLDVLVRREPFCQDSVQVWNLVEAGRIEAFIAAISVSNCYYLVRKHVGKPQAEQAIRLLRDVFTPVDLTARILDQAIDAGFSDFEDALQFHSAVHARAECILTRNPDHFPRVPLSILSPAEFLAAHPFT
jgi:predicted nucleic acid-binding protein